MTNLDIIRLFHAILSKRANVDTNAIQSMGLLAVKVAQNYALRPDLVGESKARALSKLLHKTKPLTNQEFEKRWKALAPGSLIENLDWLNPEPIASASLAQVHEGRLRDGTRVAIKIAREEYRTRFMSDLRRLKRFFRIALWFRPALRKVANPMDAIETVERQALVELNFLSEASGGRRLSAIAESGSQQLPHLKKLRIPRVFDRYSHDRLLVSEFVDGPTLADQFDSGEVSYDALLLLFRIQGYFLFVKGEFHGDLHPGNIVWKNDHFWFLDNGWIETVPPRFSHGLFEMLAELARGNINDAADRLISLSTSPLDEQSRDRLAREFATIHHDSAERPVGEISLTKRMMRTVKLAVECGLTFPSNAFPVVKCLMYLDGMVLKCAPEAKLLKDVSRFVDDFDAVPEAA